MLTKKEDTEGLEALTHQEEMAFVSEFAKGGSNLKLASNLHNVRAVNHFISQTGADGKLLYPRSVRPGPYDSSILYQALESSFKKYEIRYSQLRSDFRPSSSGKIRRSKYGLRYSSYTNFDYEGYRTGWKKSTADNEFTDTRSEDTRRNTELTLRIILQKEKERVKDEHPDFIDKEVAQKILADHYLANWASPLMVCAMSGPVCGDVRVIIDELGVENIPFEMRMPSDSTRAKTAMQAAANGGNFKMLEIYLTEYFKMKYEGKENESLYNEIQNFLCANHFIFAEKIEMLPKNIARALETAKSELQEIHGEDFDESKLKKEVNLFEEKITPEIHERQLANRKYRRNWAIGLSFTIIGAPIAWAWYGYHRAKEPISAHQTTVRAYEKYQERKLKPESFEVIENEDREALESEAPSILDKIRAKEPVKHKEKAKGKPEEWRTHKVVKLSDEGEKLIVFSSRFNDQASKFEKEIKTAERQTR